MQYRWSVPAELEIYHAFPATRYLVTTAGGQFPIIEKLPDGRLIVMVREGDFHVGQRARLVVTTSDDGGESWSETHPAVVTNPDPCHTAFGITQAGTLLIGYVLPHEYREGVWDPSYVRPCPIYLVRSDDGGQTWSPPYTVDTSSIPEPSAHPFGRILSMPDGTLLLNVLTCWAADGGALGYNLERGFASYVIRSRDGGRTWGDPSLIGRNNCIETSLLRLPSGKILSAIRHYPVGKNHDIWLSESLDDGYTWSEPRQVTQPGECPADLIRLKDGRLLLVFGYRRVPFGVRALVSHDEGQSWDYDNKLILAAESTTTDCGYPSAIQLDDGQVLVTYYVHQSPGPFLHPGIPMVGPYAAAIKFRAEDLA